jgi:prepilin-type N-terminal cleavage/methylation domain-containing protein
MNSRRGFSLVEVLCAVLILGIAVVGLTQGLTTALGSNKEAEIQSAAALLAAGQIEILRADGYLVDGETDGEGEGKLSAYKWRQTVSETRIEGLYEVTVVVEQASNGQEIYELKTLLFDPPVIREPPTNSRDKNRRRS